MILNNVFWGGRPYSLVEIYSLLRSPFRAIIIQLLQFETTNAHNFIEITIILQHTDCYMFRPSSARHQGAHSCAIECLKFSVCTRSSCALRTIKFKTWYYKNLEQIYFFFVRSCYKFYSFQCTTRSAACGVLDAEQFTAALLQRRHRT